MPDGTLTVVGTGIKLVAQTTIEAREHIRLADKAYFVVADPVTASWIRELNPLAESLHTCFAEGKPRYDSYTEVVERILESVRQGFRVCAVFYGHPGVFVYPSHEAIRRARLEGYEAVMLPGISAEDCLYADLGVDPARAGCQNFEATDFLVYRRRPDVFCSLILWQAGILGVLDHASPERRPVGIEVLKEVLDEYYPSEHPVIIYEAAQYPVCQPRIEKTTLLGLLDCSLSPFSTLYLPPAAPLVVDRKMLKRLNMKAAPLYRIREGARLHRSPASKFSRSKSRHAQNEQQSGRHRGEKF